MFIYIYISHISIHVFIYILRISLALFIYMIYFSTITHCSPWGYSTNRPAAPQPFQTPPPPNSPSPWTTPGAAQKRPVAAGVAISPVRKCRNNRLTEIQPIKHGDLIKKKLDFMGFRPLKVITCCLMLLGYANECVLSFHKWDYN